MQVEYVILVTKDDKPIGTMEKMEAHEKGVLHRAFSIFIFNSQKQLLLQMRALDKYHSPGLWTNTVCSHPRSGENVIAAANRRLGEEMGLSCMLKELFTFIYKADVGQGLKEHEFDYALVGTCDEKPTPNPYEVADYKYVDIDWIASDIDKNPDIYTEWFKIALKKLLKHRDKL